MRIDRNAKIGIIGFASGVGGKVPGAADGPAELRRLGLAKRLESLVESFRDFGDVSIELSPKEQAEIEALLSKAELGANESVAVYSACRALNDATSRVLSEGCTPIILGGAHSCSMGSISAIANHYNARGEKVGLIWVDAHADINTPITSPSGNLHGMSVSFLLGLSQGAFQSLTTGGPAINSKNMSYIGLRDLDPAEKEIIQQNKLTACTMKTVDIEGIAAATKAAIAAASSDTAGFVVSFDLDVCDPELVPGTGTPYRGGLTFREAHLIMELIHDSGKVLGLELVEYNPHLDRDGKTAELALSLLESAVGSTIL